MYYELTPAYGEDYRSAKEVIQAFQQGKDFCGDYQLDFQYCSIRDMQRGSTVLLRYRGNTMVTSTKV